MRIIRKIRIRFKILAGKALSQEENAWLGEKKNGLNNTIMLSVHEWGLEYAFLIMARKILRKINKEHIVLERYHECIEKFLYSFGKDILAYYKNNNFVEENIEETAPIWICWWQGLESAPDIVKVCVKSIHRNAGNHPIHFIHKKNYKDYINVPEDIVLKWQKGMIVDANFADIVRSGLLSKYGGIWVDATMYMTREFPRSLYMNTFFSFKREKVGNATKYVACGRWGSYFLAAGKNNILMGFVYEMQCAYWSKYGRAIDYGLIDYCIDLAYKSIPSCKASIDNYNPSNPRMHDLYTILDEEFSQKLFDELCGETYLFKLSYKRSFNSKKDGVKTFYQVLLEDKYQRKLI